MYKIYSRHFVLPPGRTKKILRIMKLTTLLLFVAFMQVSASSLAQKVTLSVNKAPLTIVLTQIKKQTGYDFAITGKILEQAKPVTIYVKNEELQDALREIFAEQPLDYSIEDKSIVISQKQPTVLDKIKNVLNLNTVEVSGRVVDEQNKPVSGATVTVKGTGNATVTDGLGQFKLKNVDDKAIIIVSYLGYEKRELPAAADMGIIKLTVTNNPLDEVKVIAYGQTSQRLSVGNIASVSAKDIEKQPVSNPLLALEGRVPGLSITPSSGVAGSGVTVRIQGVNSIANGNDPLYVIDDVPYSSQTLITSSIGVGILGQSGGLGNGGNNGGGAGNPLSFINPDDIESISILKDADATAIYGSRAANGAVLITTKKGKAGEMRVNLNLQQGIADVPKEVSLLNTQQYLTMRHKAEHNDGIANPTASDYDINGTWDTTRYTDWQKMLIGRNAMYTDMNASVSGGTTNVQYLIGSTYHRETPVYPGNFDDQKTSVHFNITSASANQKFHVTILGSYLEDNNHLPSFDLTGSALTLAPDAPQLYNADGSLNWAQNKTGTSTWTNPLFYELQSYQSKSNNLVANGNLQYDILPHLKLTGSFGYNETRTTEMLDAPLTSVKPEQRPFASSVYLYSDGTQKSWIIEPQLNYKTVFRKNTLSVLVGTTIQQADANGINLRAQGYSSDALIGDLNSAASISSNLTTSSVYKYNALFGRINYNWNEEFIVDLTTRRDGSSRFGSANQFHNFSSVGAAWIFTQAQYLESHFPALSFGKLRGSYGTTGNDQIGNYTYLSLYNPVFQGNPYQGSNALMPAGLPNSHLQWEETKKMQVGLDLGFFKDRLLFTANYARNRSSNQLLSYNLPTITGFANILTNFPATVQNTSWEFLLQGIIFKSSDFSWNSNLNLTIPKNTLVAFPGLATSGYAQLLVIGKPLNVSKVFHYQNVDPATGVYQFSDIHGNATFNPQYGVDNYLTETSDPAYYAGFKNTFSYKRLQLDVMFQYVRQKTNLGFLYGNLGRPAGRKLTNQYSSVLSSWQNPGDNAQIERYSSNNTLINSAGYFDSSDAAWSYDGSFLRLKNVSLSYQLPYEWIHHLGMKSTNIFLHGENLITFTKFKGLDPETMSALPQLRVITLGLQAGF